MVRLSISRAWEESRAIFARDGGLLTAVALALLVLPEVVVGLIAPSPDARSTAGDLLQLAAGLIALIAQLALIRLAIGPATTVGESIVHGTRRFPAMIGAVLLLMAAFVLVLLPIAAALAAAGVVSMPTERQQPTGALGLVIFVLVLLAVAISVRLTMIASVASAEPVGPLTIIKRSWALTRGHYWRLLALEMLLLIAALALLIAAQAVGGIIGRLISAEVAPMSLGALVFAVFLALAQGTFTILASVMLARVYVQLAGEDAVEIGVPSSGS